MNNLKVIVKFIIFIVSKGFKSHIVFVTQTNKHMKEVGSLWAILETGQHNLVNEDHCHTYCQINFFPESVMHEERVRGTPANGDLNKEKLSLFHATRSPRIGSPKIVWWSRTLSRTQAPSDFQLCCPQWWQ